VGERDEEIDLGSQFAHSLDHRRFPGVDQLAQEKIVPLKRHDNGNAGQSLPKQRNGTSNQEIREIDQVRLAVLDEPIDKPFVFPAQHAVSSFHRRQGHGAELAGIDGNRSLGGGATD